MSQKKFLLKIARSSTALLLYWALGSSAMTLGDLQGKVWIGKPLDVVTTVQFDTADAVSADCFDAEVFHADVRQDPSQVRVQVQMQMQSAPQPQSAKVRIVSSIPVDEPVVTVDLHVRCGQDTTRHYVLLADLPDMVEAAPLPVPERPVPLFVDLPTQSIAAAPTAQVSAPAGIKPKLPTASPPLAAVKPVPRAALAPKKAPATAGKPAPVPIKPATAGAVKPQLKLDPLDKPAKRAVAPVPLTAASAEAPNVAQLEAQNKLLAMQADLKAVRSAAAKTERQLAELKLRLQNAEAERFSALVVYVLLALLLASLGTAAWLWQRQRNARRDAKNWWDNRPMMAAASAPAPTTPAVEKADSASVGTQRQASAAPASKIDVSMIDSSSAAATDSAPAPTPAPATAPTPRPAIVKPVVAPADKGTALPSSESATAAASAKPRQPQELDLDLPGLEPVAPPPSPKPAPVPELPLPKPAPVPEPPLSKPASDKPAPADNLIDFDFTDPPKL